MAQPNEAHFTTWTSRAKSCWHGFAQSCTVKSDVHSSIHSLLNLSNFLWYILQQQITPIGYYHVSRAVGALFAENMLQTYIGQSWPVADYSTEADPNFEKSQLTEISLTWTWKTF